MLERDNYALKKWQESYFQELYSEFRTLVEKYNNGLQVKAEKLEQGRQAKAAAAKAKQEQLQKAREEAFLRYKFVFFLSLTISFT